MTKNLLKTLPQVEKALQWPEIKDLAERYSRSELTRVLRSTLEEIRAAAPQPVDPQMEDIWNLHGGIVYIGIRRHIYQVPTPEEPAQAIERAVDRFLHGYGVT